MRWRRKHFFLPIIFLLSFFGLIALIIFTSPDQQAPFPTVPTFFLAVFLAIFAGSAFLLREIRWGILVATFITVFFLLNLMKLTHPVYLVTLLVALVLFELALREK